MKMMQGAFASRLQEKVAYARRTHSHEHLHELRSADGEERHARFARNGTRQQRFSRPRWANEQHALGYPSAKAPVGLRVLEKGDGLLQLGLGLVHAGDIIEADLRVAFDVDLRLAFSDGHEPSAHALPVREASKREEPDADEDGSR
jgi:hypothetical protein